MKLGSFDREPEQAAGVPVSERVPVPSQGRLPLSIQSVAAWLRTADQNPGVVELIRRARRMLPGDPEFGDPLSTAGDGGPRAAARAAGRLMRERGAATREASLGALQLWQALTEAVSRQPANPELTLVFTDLVGFSGWSLQAGDDATLTLLRRVAQAIEPPLLDAGGHIVKRMGDGIMAVFTDPTVALLAVLTAQEALKGVNVAGYAPEMRVGIHTGRPQRLAADWLGVDVNIAARVMERATRGGIMVSGTTLDQISRTDLDTLDVTVKRARGPLLGPLLGPVFAGKSAGLPADLALYRISTPSELTGTDEADDAHPHA